MVLVKKNPALGISCRFQPQAIIQMTSFEEELWNVIIAIAVDESEVTSNGQSTPKKHIKRKLNKTW